LLQIIKFTFEISFDKTNPVNIITGMAEDSEGNVWISSGSSFSGAYSWDGKQWKHFFVGGDSGFPIHKIRKDKQGRLWFLGLGYGRSNLTENAPGAYLFENGLRPVGKFIRYGKEEGLLDGRVYAFDEGNDSSLWFGTYGGISKWKNGTWKYWTSANGVRSLRVFTLAVDRKNRVWFGDNVSQTGLGSIDEHDSIHSLTTKDGIADNDIWDVRVDSSGVVWVSTSKGLCSYENGEWKIYNEKSGLHHLAIWPVLPTKDKIYVGTLGKGLAILKRNIAIPPPPKIIFQTPMVVENDVVLRWKTFSYFGEVEPKDIFTRYRLDGNEWSSWNTQNEIRFYNLSAREHSIEVQAKGAFGQYDNNGVKKFFAVLAPYYFRPLFYLPMSVALAGIIAFITLIYKRKREADKQLKFNEERYRILTELMADYAYYDEVDEHGQYTILWMTDSFERLTGYTVEESKAPYWLFLSFVFWVLFDICNLNIGFFHIICLRVIVTNSSKNSN